ncbi:uncharacterized protein Gasu_20590 [Galdieria sulphuraria]|uniref:GRIP domain-containing protein n=1 Tax=Galdieria sulphuraria TaxID=130081 RepID=M2XKD3_GALSU|nr:uncharacterized protein Gasu_20590 [Galdieria sulphuraria]EME30597.1 hypothetical protein Gasu_20590 [Galdieria sulphuraria]|eukprot:XP_005707117.1 hypothetical protein Gasu_20590 [Galdieria sulphuraria]
MNTWKERLRAGIDKMSESTKVLSDELRHKLEESSGKGVESVQVSPQLVQRLERALQEKELQCEALFQAKQSMELSIRQIITGENQADVFLQLQSSLEEERRTNRQCVEEKERLSLLLQEQSQVEREWREKVDNLEEQLAQWKEKAVEVSKLKSEKEEIISNLEKEVETLKQDREDLDESKQRMEALQTQLSQVKSKAKEFIHSKLSEMRAENASLKEIIAAKEEEINKLKQSNVVAVETPENSLDNETSLQNFAASQRLVEECKSVLSSVEIESEEYDSYFQGLSELCRNLCSTLDVSDRNWVESSEAMVGTQVEKLKRLLASIGDSRFENIHNKLMELKQILIQLESELFTKARSKPSCEEMEIQTEDPQAAHISRDISTSQEESHVSTERQDQLEKLRKDLESEKEREEELKRALEKLKTIDSKRRDKLAILQKEKDELDLALQKLTEEYNSLQETNSSLERKWKEAEEERVSLKSRLFCDKNSSMSGNGCGNPTSTEETCSISQVTVDIEEERGECVRLLDEIDEIVKYYRNHVNTCSNSLESLESHILNEMESHHSMEDASESQSFILQLQNELKAIQQVLASTREDKETLEKSISQREDELEALKENFRNAMQNFSKEKETLEKRYEEHCESYRIQIKQMEDENHSLNSTVHQLKLELAAQEESLSKKQSAIGNLESSLEREHRTVEDLREQIARIKDEFLKYKEKARAALGQRDKTIRDVDNLLEKTNEEYRTELDNLKLQIAQLEERISQLVEEKETLLEQERMEAKEREKQLEEELSHVKEEKSKRLEETFSTLTERESKILFLESRLEDSHIQIRRLEVSLDQESGRLQEERQRWEQKVEELTWQNSDLQNKIQSLQRELSRWKSVNNSSSSNLVGLSNTGDQHQMNTTTFVADSRQLQDAESDLKLYEEQLEFLKKELRDLNNKYQAAQKLKEDITFEYLRNVFLRFLQTDDWETLLPVISRILQFTDEQCL